MFLPPLPTQSPYCVWLGSWLILLAHSAVFTECLLCAWLAHQDEQEGQEGSTCVWLTAPEGPSAHPSLHARISHTPDTARSQIWEAREHAGVIGPFLVLSIHVTLTKTV